MAMRFKRSKGGSQGLRRPRNACEQFVRFDVIQNGVAGSGGHGMGLVSKSMLERATATFKSLDNIGCDENRAERSVAAGNSLPRENDVGLDAPMPHSEWFACAADAGHHFILDEKHAALAANLRDARGVSFRRHGGAECRANDGLEDESGGGG